MDKTRRVLANAFVLTLAAGGSVLAAGACNNTVSSTVSSADCPAIAPADGSACDLAELSCSYEIICGDERREARCEGGSWQVTIPPPCNPPPCPDDLPGYSESCSEVGQQCTYHINGGCPPSLATCEGNGWSIDHQDDGFCNPPPACPSYLPVNGASCDDEYTPGGVPMFCSWEVDSACGPTTAHGGCEVAPNGQDVFWVVTLEDDCASPPQQCHSYGHETLCEGDSGCQWLVPGCDTDGPPLIVEGCYPVGVCDASSCGEWGSCHTAVADPCYQSNCGACGSEETVCAAPGQM